MPEPADEATEIDVKAGPVSFRSKSKYMAELVALASLVLLNLLAYVFWQHQQETKASYAAFTTEMRENTKELTGVIKDLNVSMKAQTNAQREMNCLIALPAERREREYESPNSFCKRMTRE
jgi:uncharacterized membrane protein YhiD involved in acid resistance